MNDAPSLNTRAILLLTAPLIIGRERGSSPKPLAPGEYDGRIERLSRPGRYRIATPSLFPDSVVGER